MFKCKVIHAIDKEYLEDALPALEKRVNKFLKSINTLSVSVTRLTDDAVIVMYEEFEAYNESVQ